MGRCPVQSESAMTVRNVLWLFRTPSTSACRFQERHPASHVSSARRPPSWTPKATLATGTWPHTPATDRSHDPPRVRRLIDTLRKELCDTEADTQTPARHTPISTLRATIPDCERQGNEGRHQCHLSSVPEGDKGANKLQGVLVQVLQKKIPQVTPREDLSTCSRKIVRRAAKCNGKRCVLFRRGV